MEIFDSHMHPFDVLGIHQISNKDSLLGENGEIKINPPSLLEYLEYSKFSLYLLKAVFRYLPGIIEKSILNSFNKTDQKHLIYEMDEASIDKSVLVPVEPFVSSQTIFQKISSHRFLTVGSIDIYKIPINEIEKNITDQIKNFGIVGLKLHPNIQGFFPQPSMNDFEIAEKLRKIYETAEKNRIYILIHGGISHLLNNKKSTVEYGVLENFCDSAGKSEIFKYDIPFIIAHMGSYNVIKPNYKLLKIITDNYKNVFFDTSGVGPVVISRALSVIGIDRIIFGTDAPYFRIKFNLKIVLKALQMADVKENFEERIIKVFSYNYKNILNRN